MRHLREILRQKWVLKRSHRDAHRSLGVSLGVISDTLARAKAKQLDWAGIEKLSDEQLEALLYVRPSQPADCRRHTKSRPRKRKAQRRTASCRQRGLRRHAVA